MPTLFHSLLSGERKRVSIVLFPSTLHAVHRYVQGCSPFLPFCIRDRCSCPRRVCNSNMKGALMSVSDKLLLRKRAIIETVNDELKNIAQVEHSRHLSWDYTSIRRKIRSRRGGTLSAAASSSSLILSKRRCLSRSSSFLRSSERCTSRPSSTL